MAKWRGHCTLTKEMEKKYTRLEFLDKLSDSVEEQYAMCDNAVMDILKNNKHNLIFTEKEKNRIKRLIHNSNVLSSMAEGLEWYYEQAVSEDNLLKIGTKND